MTDNYLCVCGTERRDQLSPATALGGQPAEANTKFVSQTFDHVKWLPADAGASSGPWQTHQREQGKCRKRFFIHDITKDFKMLSVGGSWLRVQALSSVPSELQCIAVMSFIMNRTVSTPRAVQRPCSGVRSSVARAVAPRPQRRAAQFITRATEVIVSGLRAAAATARCGARS